MTTYTDGTSTTAYSVARHGQDGAKGADGKAGPSIVFRGEYDPKETYYGNDRRVDVVHYGTQYYVATPTAGMFSDILPTNTAKWNAFGASFDSIATGLLLAERAVVDNLTVRELATADEGERITVAGNSMLMFDEGNKIRLEVTGGKADLGNASDMAVIQGGGYAHGAYTFDRYDKELSKTVSGKIGTFTISNDNMTCVIPAIIVRCDMIKENIELNIDRWDLKLKGGTDDYTWGDYLDIPTAQGGETFNIESQTVKLSKGTYDLYLFGEFTVFDVESDENHYIDVGFTPKFSSPYVTVTSSDTAQLVRIAANGMAIHLGNQLSAIFGTDIDDGKPGIVLQGMKGGQPVGLRIDGTNGIRVNR